ncbi:hypothetical protein LFM09_00340 [Lentzea alba]|uniref:LppU/SCO3897 family protein n=1 Tax=Lentzea alba TaxID=2714351 RepID=UPI0039BF7044
MSTPPSQPHDPANPWANAPAGPAPYPQVPGQYPQYPAQYPAPGQPPVPGQYPYPGPNPGQQYPGYPNPEPPRKSSSGKALLIVAGLVVLAVALSAAVFLRGGGKDDKAAAASSAAPTTTTTTTTKPKAFAEIGDCVSMTGGSFNPTYKKVECTANQHNYTVSKVPASSSEKCGTTDEGYIKYTKGSSVTVCLIPVFAEGECYDFTLASLNAEYPKKACGGYMVVKAKVIAGTADKAACGTDERLALALAYPEIKTTYCLTHTFTIG